VHSVSVALEPLRAPRSDGVTTLTGNGPLSVPLPAESIVRTTMLRWPTCSAVGVTVLRARSPHGRTNRALQRELRAPTSAGVPVTSISSTRRMPTLSVALSTTGSEPLRGPPASSPSADTVGTGGCGSLTVMSAP
jgi:hypothetical protein